MKNENKSYNMNGFTVGDIVLVSAMCATVKDGKTILRERKIRRAKLMLIGKYFSDYETFDGHRHFTKNENIFNSVVH